ncbi:1-aminocyclopropane-1-carboxylate oxidase 9 [Grifola frondosa]|uniref:1-aminocyclopropane-1-carboxylate oxidase 9 n=1 Tax=Grifola frondosa TaxID=5627 RepID=A0A1C7LPW7_GRIFR|nr:1-aminocyclopropane-1-carboxylate oxidase 9 [Grifola frondosa]
MTTGAYLKNCAVTEHNIPLQTVLVSEGMSIAYISIANMPSTILPPVAHYVPAPPTKENLDYADLAIVDLSKAQTAAGRAELAAQVKEAMSGQGFFYVVNHGYTQAQTERMVDIADIPFTLVDDEEKRRFAPDIKKLGSYQGYKLRQYWHIDAGVRDQIEHYNINHDITRKQHPKALQPVLPEIDAFIRPATSMLFALGLELPEDTFVNNHNFDAVGETWARFMKYYPRSEEDEVKTKNVWLKGHTDTGSISILWSQPVAALQILSPDGKWRWVRHIDNALVVNAGDTMESARRPGGYARLGLFYFTMPDDDVKIAPMTDSPVVQKHGIVGRFTNKDIMTMEQWRKARISAYGQSQLQKKENGTEEEVINGIVGRGNIFSLANLNVTTDEEFEVYIQQVYYADTSLAALAPLFEAYPSDPAVGSPYGMGNASAFTPEYKRMASLQGDLFSQVLVGSSSINDRRSNQRGHSSVIGMLAPVWVHLIRPIY